MLPKGIRLLVIFGNKLASARMYLVAMEVSWATPKLAPKADGPHLSVDSEP